MLRQKESPLLRVDRRDTLKGERIPSLLFRQKGETQKYSKYGIQKYLQSQEATVDKLILAVDLIISTFCLQIEIKRNRTTPCSIRQCELLLDVRNSKNYILLWGCHCSSSPLFYNSVYNENFKPKCPLTLSQNVLVESLLTLG